MNPIRQTWCVRPLLENHRTAVRTSQFPPTNARHFSAWTVARRHRLVCYKRFVSAEVSVCKAKQRPLSIAEVIDLIRGTWLRDTRARATAKAENRVEWLRRQRVGQREGRVRRRIWIVMEFP